MNLLQTTKMLLEEAELKAKKSLGQNFLVSEAKLDAIVQAANITDNEHILEIGPGLGTLTNELAAKTTNLTCIELDQDMVHILEKRLSNVAFTHGNALDIPPPTHPYKVVANIPYYITSPLINHYIKDAENRPKSMVLLVQKEIADKLTAGPGKLSVLALNVQTFAKVEKITIVKPGCFYPPPKVDSAVIRITPYEKPLITSTPKTYFKIISMAFRQKRKMLKKSLKPFGIDSTRRPQELSIEEWDALANTIDKS